MQRLGLVEIIKFRALKMRAELSRVFNALIFLFIVFQTLHVWLSSACAFGATYGIIKQLPGFEN